MSKSGKRMYLPHDHQTATRLTRSRNAQCDQTSPPSGANALRIKIGHILARQPISTPATIIVKDVAASDREARRKHRPHFAVSARFEMSCRKSEIIPEDEEKSRQ